MRGVREFVITGHAWRIGDRVLGRPHRLASFRRVAGRCVRPGTSGARFLFASGEGGDTEFVAGSFGVRRLGIFFHECLIYGNY